ncbi:MAG: four helix bundle protein [Desulfobacterales bacterium]|nr:four helix bundle protein [Desulfobacterales bacterium]MDX2511984.1 four helix bundle protein [Desulfobacterales bacterium]
MSYIYEKLDVWQKAMQFAGDVIDSVSMMGSKDPHQEILQQTEGSAVTIAGAIAMGKSYSSKHDFARHLYQSRGALYKTMTLLELLKRNHLITEEIFAGFDNKGNQLTAMLTSLIKSIYTPKNDKPAS